jgi:hypothetical protein
MQRDVPLVMQRENLGEGGVWRWEPFVGWIAQEVERRTGRLLDQEQRRQIQASLEMAMR